MNVNYESLPEGMREAARLYIRQGKWPGCFLYACLANDLREAVRAADDENRARLSDVVRWIHDYCPRQSYGSLTIVRAWTKGGGLRSWYVASAAKAAEAVKREVEDHTEPEVTHRFGSASTAEEVFRCGFDVKLEAEGGKEDGS